MAKNSKTRRKTAPRTEVLVLMGSDSDWKVMSAALEELEALDLRTEVMVASAHRTPERVAEVVQGARRKGVKVIIAGAGAAAHLAGVIASHTTLPVIGVPIDATPLGGLDALLATVQMPSGIPVATVAVGGARNAALLAAQIIAVGRPGLARKLDRARTAMRRQVAAKDRKLQKLVAARR